MEMMDRHRIGIDELMRQWLVYRGISPQSASLVERLTYRQLYALSDSGRKERSRTVSGPALVVDSYQDSSYYVFDYKSNPSTTGLRHKGYIKFIRPQNRSVPKGEDIECIVDCSCFRGDAPVLMDDGTYKPISEIRPGDSVVTHKGRVRRVTGNVERRLNPGEEVYEVGVSGFPGTVLVTGDHPFYALRGNKTCRCGCGKSLSTDIFDTESCTAERVASRRFIRNHDGHGRISNETILKIRELFETDGGPTSRIASKVGVSATTVVNVLRGNVKLTTELPDESSFSLVPVKEFHRHEWFLTPWMEQGTLHLNSDTARFLGYYLAEGSLLQHASSDDPSNIVCMTLHIDEETTIAKDVCEIAARNVDGYFRDPRPINGVQGNRVHISRCDNPEYKRPMQAIELVIYITKQFVETIVNDCGRGSHDKCFSKNLLNVDNDTATQILTGLFLGDGTVNNHKRIRWASVSRILVFQVSMLLNRLHIRHNVTNMVDAWGIDICPGDSTRTVFDWLAPYYRDWQLERRDTRNEQACRNLDEGQLRSLHEYRKVQYNGTVWDLSVDEDMSFVVNGIAVANCPDYRYRFAWANKQRGSGVVGPNSLNQAWNRAPRITNPTGRPALCVAQDELVSTSKGFLPIQNVEVGDSVWTLKGWKLVLASSKTGIKPVVDVTTASGSRIRITQDHPVYAFNDVTGFGWIQASKLTPDHFLVRTLPESTNALRSTIDVQDFSNAGSKLVYCKSTVTLDAIMAELFGYMTSEGAHTLFCNTDERLISDFESKWKLKFGNDSVSKHPSGCFIGRHGDRILESMGFVFGSYHKVVPNWIMQGDRELIIAFLRGCYAGDGNFCGKQSTYATVSEPLGRSIQLLLYSLGVTSVLRRYKSGMHSVDAWFVRTTSKKQTVKLFNILKPIRGYSSDPKLGGGSGLQDNVVRDPLKLVRNVVKRHLRTPNDERIVNVSDVHAYIPDVGMKWKSVSAKLSKSGKPCAKARICDLYDILKDNRAKTISEVIHVRKSKGTLQSRFVFCGEIEKIKDKAPEAYDELVTLTRTDVSFDKVSSVTFETQPVPVYDLTVADAAHFTVNGIVVHNCKHLLALADSIFGWMVEFRGNPEGGTINVGLDRLTKHMQRRWVNFGDEVKRARERNSRISQDRAARQVGNNPYNTYNRMTGTTIPNADDLIEPPEGPDQTTTEQ